MLRAKLGKVQSGIGAWRVLNSGLIQVVMENFLKEMTLKLGSKWWINRSGQKGSEQR